MLEKNKGGDTVEEGELGEESRERKEGKERREIGVGTVIFGGGRGKKGREDYLSKIGQS